MVSRGEGGSVKAKMTISLVCAIAVAGLLVAGCGGSGSSTSSEASSAPSSSGPAEGREAESREAAGETAPTAAQVAATAAIPDNQAYLLFREPEVGYSIRYPKGWARKRSVNDVTFGEQANLVHVAIRDGAGYSKSWAKRTFTRRSAPDPATGKRLSLTVERYQYPHGAKIGVIDLVAPAGVDNADVYRMIGNSFQWLR
jgi:hypothetical protein